MPNSCSRMYSGPISPRRISRTRSVNFTSGSVALARPASDGHGTELRRRILSAAVLVPVALLAVHLGGSALAALLVAAAEIGRASGGEKVCQYVWISVVAGSLKKKT